jgi:hypothetical protein
MKEALERVIGVEPEMLVFYHMERFQAPHHVRMSHFWISKNTRQGSF